MTPETTLPVRAFELAREGHCVSIKDLRSRLAQEGFTQIDAHFDGQSFKKQLSSLMREANANPVA